MDINSRVHGKNLRKTAWLPQYYVDNDRNFGTGEVIFYVLNENTYNYRYHGKYHDKNLIVAHLHHLLPLERDWR